MPRGASACTAARTVLLPSGQRVDEPYRLREPGGTLHIAMARYVESDAYRWSSADGGATWSGPVKVYARQPCTDDTEPLLGCRAAGRSSPR